ncbi:hypothetical protein C2S51_026396 [Perilla frutescens var. frutescens]|nr:hypothetical protein C2S51_026396 [Perilla frutescens var. frutescens]
MEDPTVAIPTLPNDVIIEILTRLPVKPLVKFRCVSKSWRALISSRQFVRIHLKNSRIDPSFTTHRIILNGHGNIKQCSVNSILHEPFSEAFDLSYSAQSEINSVRVVGSCDGLICLFTDRKDLVLWNPTTRICKKLPNFDVKINVRGYFSYGLGYDRSSDDYRVVACFNSKRYLSEVIVQVYSLRSDQWRRIENFKGRWLMDDPATFANGKLYWIADHKCELEAGWDIVSFDLEKEKYEILQMPSYVKSGYYSMLGVFEGSVYVLCSQLASADVWIMNGCSEGDKNWTKVVTIPYIDDFLKYTYKRALYLLKDGRVLLLCSFTFVIFDAKDCSFSYPEIRDLGEFFSVGAYFESLVSPVG